jgi:hypothetical protein
MRNVEQKDSILKANQAVRGVESQAGAGEGSANPAIHGW